jgi:competence ComEA-like helix-hairpin-helix protein
MRRREFILILGGALLWNRAWSQTPVDLNTATKAEIEALPGIGDKLAEEILSRRPFQSVEELLDIPRFGKNRLERIRGLVTVSGGQASESALEATPAPGASAEAPPTSEWTTPPGFKTLSCWRCEERFAVESDTETGTCPYCGVRWADRGGKP